MTALASTARLYSWNESTRTWLAIDEGSEADMRIGADRRYATARAHNVAGSAFYVSTWSAPQGTPERLGVELVAAAVIPAPSGLAAFIDALSQRPDDYNVLTVATKESGHRDVTLTLGDLRAALHVQVRAERAGRGNAELDDEEENGWLLAARFILKGSRQ